MTWRIRLLTFFLVLISLAVFGIWTINLTSGAFVDGVFASQQETSMPVFHLVAEALMAIVTLAGVIGVWRGKSWGKGITLFGLGMFTYSAINSFGWAIVNNLTQGVPMLVTVVIAIFGVPILLRYTPGK